MKNFIEIPHKCPKCNEQMDGVTSISGIDDTPDENSISVCIKCGAILRFDKDLMPQLMSNREHFQYAFSKDIIQRMTYYKCMAMSIMVKEYRLRKSDKNEN